MSGGPGNTGGRPSWRDRDGGEPDRGPVREPTPASRKGWRATGPADAERKRPDLRKRRRLQAVFKSIIASFAALGVAVIVWVISQFIGCTRTEMIIVSIDGNGRCAFPSNPVAQEDAELLQTLEDEPRLTVRTFREWPHFASEFELLSPKKVLVVYLSAQAFCLPTSQIAREENLEDKNRKAYDVYLLQPDASLDYLDPSDGDYLKQVFNLDSLADALRSLPQEQKKLLLLDLCRVQSHWRLGIVENDLTERARETFQGIPNLAVIGSCETGEASCVASEIGPEGRPQSVFAYFVTRGLDGDADQAPSDGRLTVRELYDYVSRNTNSWVQENRDPRGQHPVLLSEISAKAEDDPTFVVARIPYGRRGGSVRKKTNQGQPNSDESEAEVAVSTGTVWETVAKLWREREKIEAASRFNLLQSEPTSWSVTTDGLLRAEDLLLANQVAEARGLIGETQSRLDQLASVASHGAFAHSTSSAFISENIGSRIDFEAQTQKETARNAAAGQDHVALSEERFARDARTALVPTQTADLVDRVVELRRLAEHTVANSIGVHSAVRHLCLKADGLRREAEDWLFVGDREKTEPKAAEAHQAYTQIEAICRILQRAIRARNRLSSDLPAMAAWAAFRTPSTGSSTRAQMIREFRNSVSRNELPAPSALRTLDAERLIVPERVEVKLARLLAVGRELELQLGRVDQVDSPDELSDVAQLTSEAETVLSEVTDILESYARRLDQEARNQSTHPQPALWREIRDILRCPPVPADLRRDLHTWLRDFSQKMNRSWCDREIAESGRPENTPNKSPEDAADVTDAVFQQGMWSSFWALQVLSLGARDPVSVEDLWDRWYRTWREVTRDQRDAQALRFEAEQVSIVQLGTAMRRAWDAKRKAVDDHMRQWKKAKEPRASLVAADKMTRALHPCDASRFSGHNAPARELLHYSESELLMAEAERYIEDFWEGWYGPAASACLAATHDAGVVQFDERRQQIESLMAERERATVRVESNPVKFGTKARAEAQPRMFPDGNLPSGTAAVWMDCEKNADVVLEETRRQSMLLGLSSEGAGVRSEVFPFRKLNPERADDPRCPFTVSAKVQVFFRGHRWPETDAARNVTIHPCRPNGTTYSYRPTGELDGQIVVNGTDSRAIIFILDASLSMRTQNRWETARSVFKETLFSLAKWNQLNPDVPGVRAGVIAFGQEESSEIETLLEMQRLTEENADGIIAGLAFQPSGKTTPLLKALIAACHKLEQQKIPGTVVAITDGEYKDANPLDLIRDIDRLLEESRKGGRDIDLHLVGFAVPTGEKGVLEGLTQAGDRGRFYDAPDGPALARALKETTDPRPYRVIGSGVRLDRRLGEPCRELKAGTYRVSFASCPPLDVDILGGESLVFELDRGSIRLVAPTQKYRTDRPMGGLVFGCREFRENRQQKQARFLLCLNPLDLHTFVPRPAEMQFDIQPIAEKQPIRRSVDVYLRPNETVPTWEVTVDDWPRGSGARIQTCWKSQRSSLDAPPIAFRRSGQPTEIKLPFSGTRTVTLQVSPVQYDLTTATAVVELHPIDTKELQPRDPEFFEQLANIGVNFAPGGTAPPLDVPFTREFIEEEETLIYTFSKLPANFSRADFEMRVTSWHARKSSAFHLSTPLTIVRPDD